MKKKLIRLSQRYVTALQKHLSQGPGASLQPPLRLGLQALSLGLETLELARLHENALTTLGLSNAKNGVLKQTENFFAEALAPIVATHNAAQQSKIELIRLNETLTRRTLELAATNRQLRLGIIRRKNVESALKKSGEHYAKLLKESLQLQEGLRQLTHRVLAGQEKERKNISRELQDEVAQTLLGINVRLINLKQGAHNNTRGLKNEIANTQRLVIKSKQTLRRTVREFRKS